MLSISLPIYVFGRSGISRSFLGISPYAMFAKMAGRNICAGSCELTYTNTLLLSNASLSPRCDFICEVAEVGDVNFPIIPLILTWTFIALQVKEFHTSGFYMNDSIFGVSSFPCGVAFLSCYRWSYSYMPNTTHRVILKVDIGIMSYRIHIP